MVRKFAINSRTVKETCFTEEERKLLFLAKCSDLNINVRENLENKFNEYCERKCVDRYVDFSEVSMLIYHLSVILGITPLRYSP
jgi:hypothetical protein